MDSESSGTSRSGVLFWARIERSRVFLILKLKQLPCDARETALKRRILRAFAIRLLGGADKLYNTNDNLLLCIPIIVYISQIVVHVGLLVTKLLLTI